MTCVRVPRYSPFHSYYVTILIFITYVFERGCKAIAGKNYKIASHLHSKIIAMQMRKGNSEKKSFYAIKRR